MYGEYLAFHRSLVNMGTVFLSLSEGELKECFYKLRTREDIATLLQISDRQLRYHLHTRKKTYTQFEIPKKSGEKRSILAPKTSLKIIQQRLNQVLRSVYQPKPSTHGFTVNKSIVTNAAQHIRQRYVLNLDLKDFSLASTLAEFVDFLWHVRISVQRRLQQS